MTESASITALAVDGGGTRCRIAAVHGDEVVSIEAGSANVSTDFEGSIRTVLEGLGKLSDMLDVAVNLLQKRPAFIGLAGMDGQHIARRIRQELSLDCARIEDDRIAALRGALGRNDGFIAHCGTGSFFGAQAKGHQRLVGGWGSVLADEASAYWIGRLALRRTLNAVDGLGPASNLTKHLLAKFESPADIVSFAVVASPADIGRIARDVTASAEDGDPVAAEVMQSGANQITQVLHGLGWRPGAAICLTGGIGPYYAPFLPAEMEDDLTTPTGTPLEGAISLALDLAREFSNERV